MQMNNFLLAVQISLIGIGLVFASILALWAIMAVIVRLTQDQPKKLIPAPELEPVLGSKPNEIKKRRAAAAAVALALAEINAASKPDSDRQKPADAVSPWQTVMRTRMLNKRGTPR
jgi:Na+-transporting methylmalonyl-CoA/oxaloacetate decarboxylase gamma subunit